MFVKFQSVPLKWLFGNQEHSFSRLFVQLKLSFPRTNKPCRPLPGLRLLKQLTMVLRPLWSRFRPHERSTRKRGPSCMSAPNLKRIALASIRSKVIRGSKNFEIEWSAEGKVCTLQGLLVLGNESSRDERSRGRKLQGTNSLENECSSIRLFPDLETKNQ